METFNKTKQQLSDEIGFTVKVIRGWHKVARANLSDYKALCYVKGKPLIRASLKPYQCWIIHQIADLKQTQQMRYNAQIAQEFQQNPSRYSFTYFQQIHQQSA